MLTRFTWKRGQQTSVAVVWNVVARDQRSSINQLKIHYNPHVLAPSQPTFILSHSTLFKFRPKYQYVYAQILCHTNHSSMHCNLPKLIYTLYQRMLKCPVFCKCKGFLLETAYNILTTWKTAATCLKKLETVIVTGRNESSAVPISSAFQLSCLSGVPLFGRSSDDFRKLSYGEKVEPAEERYRSTQHRVHQLHAATTNVT